MTSASSGILYIVATPIGNLGDITARAIETLKSVDLIASEDTRTSGFLLKHFGINTPQTSYHEHNERQKAPELVHLLQEGKSIALISDAGTPLVSDPGFRLVNEAISAGIEIIPIPGPSSILAALVASGFPTDRFCFEGYLPKSSGKLARRLGELSHEPRTMIFFETQFRILKSLPVMLEAFGDREIFIGRELTKKFEEKMRGKISEIIELLKNRTIKGEMVVVVSGTGYE
jgi:16S rRNA (cytidine1402-2'-O)-methyltransferase